MSGETCRNVRVKRNDDCLGRTKTNRTDFANQFTCEIHEYNNDWKWSYQWLLRLISNDARLGQVLYCTALIIAYMAIAFLFYT